MRDLLLAGPPRPVRRRLGRIPGHPARWRGRGQRPQAAREDQPRRAPRVSNGAREAGGREQTMPALEAKCLHSKLSVSIELADQGLVETCWQGSPRRHLYRLTAAGQAAAWEALTAAQTRLLARALVTSARRARARSARSAL